MATALLAPEPVTAQRFAQLAAQWKTGRGPVSSLSEMVMHPAYQQIIGMGQSAIPFLLRELEQTPDHWFWALKAITGIDPVPPEHRGDLARMSDDWLRWGGCGGVGDATAGASRTQPQPPSRVAVPRTHAFPQNPLEGAERCVYAGCCRHALAGGRIIA